MIFLYYDKIIKMTNKELEYFLETINTDQLCNDLFQNIVTNKDKGSKYQNFIYDCIKNAIEKKELKGKIYNMTNDDYFIFNQKTGYEIKSGGTENAKGFDLVYVYKKVIKPIQCKAHKNEVPKSNLKGFIEQIEHLEKSGIPYNRPLLVSCHNINYDLHKFKTLSTCKNCLIMIDKNSNDTNSSYCKIF